MFNYQRIAAVIITVLVSFVALTQFLSFSVLRAQPYWWCYALAAGLFAWFWSLLPVSKKVRWTVFAIAAVITIFTLDGIAYTIAALASYAFLTVAAVQSRLALQRA